MPGPIKNPRHEAYCQARARGLDGVEAWMAVRPKTSRVTAYGQACRFAKDSAINARIKELSAKATNTIEKAVDRLVEKKAGETAETVARIIGAALTQAELLAFVSNIVLSTPAEIGDGRDSMLVGSIKPGKFGDTLEVCDKLRAAELAAKLQGFLVDRVEATVDDKRVKPPDERARLLRESIARRQATHGAS